MGSSRRLARVGGRLPARALVTLGRIGDLQLSTSSRAVSVTLVLDGSSSASWESLHALGRRLLIDTVEPYSVRLTRAGWATWRQHRGSS